MIESYAHNIADDASKTAWRAGDVLFREGDGNIPTGEDVRSHAQATDLLDEIYELTYSLVAKPSYTEFLYDPDANAQLIPSAKKYDVYSHLYDYDRTTYIDKKSLWSELQARRIGLRHKAAVTLGGMATAAGGMELATHNTVFDIVGLAAGGVMGWIYNGAQDFRTIRQLRGELKDIQSKLELPEHLIRLPNVSTAHYISAQEMATFGHTEIPVAGTQAATLSAEDILTWLERKIATDKIVYQHDYSRHQLTPLRSKGASVKLDTPLWELFYNSHTRSGIDYGDDVSRIAKQFVEVREKIAHKLKLQLIDTKPKLDQMVFLGMDQENLNKKFRHNWKDVKLNFVQIPAGLVVSRLLRLDNDPTGLWQQIAPDLLTIQDNAIEQASISKELKAIDRRAQHAGVTNQEDEIMKHGWQQRLNEVEGNILMTTLSVAGAAVLRDRARRYDTVREELLQTIGQTAHAEDQFGAMQLFDAGITALAQRLNPDSEEAISTARSLKQYLIDSVRHINGTESAYRQLYQGMQKRFPQLQLTNLRSTS